MRKERLIPIPERVEGKKGLSCLFFYRPFVRARFLLLSAFRHQLFSASMTLFWARIYTHGERVLKAILFRTKAELVELVRSTRVPRQ